MQLVIVMYSLLTINYLTPCYLKNGLATSSVYPFLKILWTGIKWNSWALNGGGKPWTKLAGLHQDNPWPTGIKVRLSSYVRIAEMVGSDILLWARVVFLKISKHRAQLLPDCCKLIPVCLLSRFLKTGYTNVLIRCWEQLFRYVTRIPAFLLIFWIDYLRRQEAITNYYFTIMHHSSWEIYSFNRRINLKCSLVQSNLYSRPPPYNGHRTTTAKISRPSLRSIQLLILKPPYSSQLLTTPTASKTSPQPSK